MYTFRRRGRVMFPVERPDVRRKSNEITITILAYKFHSIRCVFLSMQIFFFHLIERYCCETGHCQLYRFVECVGGMEGEVGGNRKRLFRLY